MFSNYRSYVRNRPKFFKFLRRRSGFKGARLSREVQPKASGGFVGRSYHTSQSGPYMQMAEDYLNKHPSVGKFFVKNGDYMWNKYLRKAVRYPLKMARRGQLRGYRDL